MSTSETPCHRALLYILIASTFMWLCVELGSYGLIYVYYTTTAGKHSEAAHKERMQRLGSFLAHPLWSGFPDNGQESPAYPYSPYISHRLRAMGEMPPLSVDRYGFIHNGDQNRTLSVGDEAIRILLLGGSNVMGSGASANAQTLGGHLERLLNAQGNGQRYQVINAGVGGFYSPLETVYFITELVHYKPSLVFMLDGFNEFWHAYPPSKDSSDDSDWSIPNRSAEQQEHLVKALGKAKTNLMERLTQPSMFTRIFRFSAFALSHAVNRTTPKDGRSDAPPLPPGSDPWRDNARWVRTNVYGTASHAPFTAANWRSMIGIAKGHGLKIAVLFLPFYPISHHPYTQDEQNSITAFFKERSWIDPDEYRAFSTTFHADIQKHLDALRQQYSSDASVYIADWAGVFDAQTQAVFADVGHFTDKGNEVLAENIKEIVLSLLASRSGS